AEVQDVEEGTNAGRVHRVLGVDGDELRVEVLLGQVAGEGSEDADGEYDDADHPRRGASVAPAGHEVLTPQVQDHEDEEELHRPEVEAVEEPADPRVMPPLRTEKQKHNAPD